MLRTSKAFADGGGKVLGRAAAGAEPRGGSGLAACETQEEGQRTRRAGSWGVSWKGRTGSCRILKGVPRSQDFYSECDKEGLAWVLSRGAGPGLTSTFQEDELSTQPAPPPEWPLLAISDHGSFELMGALAGPHLTGVETEAQRGASELEPRELPTAEGLAAAPQPANPFGKTTCTKQTLPFLVQLQLMRGQCQVWGRPRSKSTN